MKMVQIVECTEDILKSVPNVIELLYEIYGAKTIGLFAVVVDNELGFIGRDGANCVYIHKNGYNNFTLNENEELAAVKKGEYNIYFGSDVYFEDAEKIEHTVNLYSLDELDQDEYNGCVSYKQYNPESDTLCEIRYQHMYRELDGKPIIYSYHTSKIDSLYIDENYIKMPTPKKGLLPKRCKYYSRLEFEDDMVGYKWAMIKDYGLENFLNGNCYNLQKERNVIRYIKTLLIDADGNYRDFWPLGEQLTRDDINTLIASYGFNTSVPNEILNIYNGYDELINNLFEIVLQMKVISKEAKEKENYEKFALLTLKNS